MLRQLRGRLWSLRRRGPSSISVPNLKSIAHFVQKLLRGSQNWEIRSRDRGHARFWVVLWSVRRDRFHFQAIVPTYCSGTEQEGAAWARSATLSRSSLSTSQAALPRSTVITATSVSYGKMEILTPCKIETLKQIDTQFVRIDYVHERNVCSKFGKNPYTGDFWAKGWNITFCVTYLFIYFFFLGPT